jgi:hypothetical protein
MLCLPDPVFRQLRRIAGRNVLQFVPCNAAAPPLAARAALERFLFQHRVIKLLD